jgi:hypothetical protein
MWPLSSSISQEMVHTSLSPQKNALVFFYLLCYNSCKLLILQSCLCRFLSLLQHLLSTCVTWDVTIFYTTSTQSFSNVVAIHSQEKHILNNLPSWSCRLTNNIYPITFLYWSCQLTRTTSTQQYSSIGDVYS